MPKTIDFHAKTTGNQRPSEIELTRSVLKQFRTIHRLEQNLTNLTQTVAENVWKVLKHLLVMVFLYKQCGRVTRYSRK